MVEVLNLVGLILDIPIFIICFVIPCLLTLSNVKNLFMKKKTSENLVDILTFSLGTVLTALLFFLCHFKDYNEAIIIGDGSIQLHSPVASWSYPTVLAIFILGLISYILIRVKKLQLPPLVIVGAMSGIFICSVQMIIFIIQLCRNISSPYYILALYLMLFPLNYILCSIRAEIEIMKLYKEKNLTAKAFNNKFLNKCSSMLYKIDSWPLLAVVFSIPLAAILICILVLFGQRPDEAIRAFLETSDWTLSKEVSPPPVVVDSHYLCTVSLRGHKNIVKPTRMGIRHGEKIVVNRQLCIANAFEDLIKERTPKFHRFVRYIYDKYGYPLSKHINTAIQADITYIIMKPLEWIFLGVLYAFDKKPENRIAVQYVGQKIDID